MGTTVEAFRVERWPRRDRHGRSRHTDHDTGTPHQGDSGGEQACRATNGGRWPAWSMGCRPVGHGVPRTWSSALERAWQQTRAGSRFTPSSRHRVAPSGWRARDVGGLGSAHGHSHRPADDGVGTVVKDFTVLDDEVLAGPVCAKSKSWACRYPPGSPSSLSQLHRRPAIGELRGRLVTLVELEERAAGVDEQR